MNTIFIAEVFSPDVIGGAGKYANLIVTGLVRKGHKVTVVTRQVRDLPKKEEIDGVQVVRVDWEKIFFLFKPLVFIVKLQQDLKEISLGAAYDLVVFGQPLSALGALLCKEINRLNKVYLYQSSWGDEFEAMREIGEIKRFALHRRIKRWFYLPVLFLMRRMEEAALKKTPRIIVLSQFSKNRILELYPDIASEIAIIPGAVDTDKFKPGEDKGKLRRELKLQEEAFILLTVRNLVPRMGLDNLIIAFAGVAARFPLTRLVIVGGGFLEGKLKSLTERLGLTQRIDFIGPLKEGFLFGYYQAADLFVLPTRSLEGFGLVTLEAMACGLPVLGTPVGGTVEILTKFDKDFLFAGTSPQAIAGKIIEFIDGKPDLTALKQRCREFVLREYSQEKWLDQMEHFFND